MKIFTTTVFCMLLSCCILQVQAQTQKEVPVSQYNYNKPKLFKDLPERINLRLNDFDELFTAEEGKSVSLPLSQEFTFSGTVVSKAEDVNANVKSIVIKSTNKVGASLALSRIINENNTITYRGRIMSFKHGDAYEVTFENGSYYLIKKNLYDLYDE